MLKWMKCIKARETENNMAKLQNKSEVCYTRAFHITTHVGTVTLTKCLNADNDLL